MEDSVEEDADDGLDNASAQIRRTIQKATAARLASGEDDGKTEDVFTVRVARVMFSKPMTDPLLIPPLERRIVQTASVLTSPTKWPLPCGRMKNAMEEACCRTYNTIRLDFDLPRNCCCVAL
jgi:hypothetical protein